MRRAFLVNSDKCIGCRGCAMACKSFNQLEPERFWRYVYPLDKEIYPHVKMVSWCITQSAVLDAKTVSATAHTVRRVLMRRRRKRKNAACATSALMLVCNRLA